jgi:ribosomal protein L11 methyltransferase
MIRLAVRVRRADAEIVLAELLELTPGGVEEVDVDAGTVEYAVYGAPGELPELGDLQAAAGAALVQVSTSEVADDWEQRWRAFHRPLVLGSALTVRPPWEVTGTTELDVVIDPGRAFGTGAHATTALCLELLLNEVGSGSRAARGTCVDLGCGSGVLAIVAAQLGFTPVIALDYDPLAVAATTENAARNRIPPTQIDVRRLDLRTEQVPDAELVLANVLAGPLLAWARFQRRLAPRLILSGLLATEADRVSEAYAGRGMRERMRRVRGDWAALVLTREPIA